MFFAVAAFMLAVSSTPVDDGPFKSEIVSAKVAAWRASKCGLGRVTFHFDKEMGENVLALKGVTSANDAQLACLDRAAGMNFVVVEPELRDRFFRIQADRQEALSQARAKKWLADRGLLERVSKFAGHTDDRAFLQEVEALCGPYAKGIIQSMFGPRSSSPGMTPPTPFAEEASAFSCIMNVMTVAGYKIGFVGNEAISKPTR